MKKKLIVFEIILVIFISIFFNVNIRVNAETITELSNNSNAELQNNNNTFDIDNIIEKDEKFKETYKTSNGENYSIIGTLCIDKINIKYDILSSTSVALLKVSLNRYWGANPNEVGNMCIVGHNYLDDRFFGNLHTLESGDEIKITDAHGTTCKYYVYDMFIADPYDTRCTTQLTKGRKEITLITCYNHGTQRLVVRARAVQETKKTVAEIINDFLNK